LFECRLRVYASVARVGLTEANACSAG
jgi:hypothetical protein